MSFNLFFSFAILNFCNICCSSFFPQHPHSADGHRNDYRMYLSAAHIIASSRSHLLNVDVDKRGYIKK
ncbi:TPA: hypothetical protein I2T92_14005 [Staphylococcus aureus]|nr:hypothetical protein [Staphylococcus aureus]HAR7222884.1 hypothetical protein [Staphylococcus aureus]HAR7244646.1 hypothetical protein [Staphylococcus aureus]HAR7247507.1 hypothetical protein [Staphylococcus aureus]HAR7255083.1 hypothetical protein [Staphylococcus aureus]